jgi:predicted GIY-YIG superfamily endonuclease
VSSPKKDKPLACRLMIYTVYVLKSKIDDTRYIGFTGKDVKTRLMEHNSGHNTYTKSRHPFVLVYYEKGYCKTCARFRESFLKSGQGRKLLDSIDNTGRSSDGRTHALGA